ncbi:MAG: transglycosylase SLT domain-containing protein [Gammaproteobacteria bacterium]
MSKPIVRRTRANATPQARRKRRNQAKGVRPHQKSSGFFSRTLFVALELTGLLISIILAIIVLLGYSSIWFSGTRFFTNLLPFALGVLILVLMTTGFLIGWWKFRKLLKGRAEPLRSFLSASLALFIAWSTIQGDFALAFTHFRTLVGGKQEARRISLAHQVYAAYRRHDHRQLNRLIQRSQDFNEDIYLAAKAFDIDANLLQGVAATESSFRPRASRDGGRGLFQITRVPKAALKKAGSKLAVANPSEHIARHNAFIAAATLKYYLNEMDNDLFLGLLAYNIGPANGGLRFIMKQYGATDFSTIQPYLQKLPRDYPVRVLAYSLAFRIWQQEGKLLSYEKADNAVRIQRMGIPGLERENLKVGEY